MNIKEHILEVACGVGSDFCYYDRMGDTKLPREILTDAISDGTVTIEEISAAFLAGIKCSI